MLCWPSPLGLGLQAPGTLQCRKQIPLTVTSITASWLGAGLCVYFPFSVLGLSMCGSCVFSHSFREFM